MNGRPCLSGVSGARSGRVAWAVAVMVASLVLAGCATTRSDFQPLGERELFREDFSGGLYAWNIQTFGSHAYEQARETDRSFLRFLGHGGATLDGSLVGDFRMEFDLRLEAPVIHEIAYAMINFRNYFDRRYCLIVEPQTLGLTGAWVKHNQLDDLRRVSLTTTLGKWYHYEIVAVGSHIRVFRNGYQVIDVEDPHATVAQGNIWFESWSRYSIADVRVWSLQDFVRVPKEPPVPVGGTLAAATAGGKITLAVAEFENLGLAGYEASLLSDLFAAALLDTGAFRVADRQELGKVLDEQQLQLSDLVAGEGAVKIGQILAARYLATGSLGSLGSTYVVTLKVLDVETGETLVTVHKDFPEASGITRQMRALATELAARLAKP
jgi:hypothetical protein